jgi:hypothetical protein
MVDDLLGNSARQLWEKVPPMIEEARERYDPRLYEHFEFLYDESQPALVCARQESNLRPLPPQGSALSPELRARGESSVAAEVCSSGLRQFSSEEKRNARGRVAIAARACLLGVLAPAAIHNAVGATHA